MQNRRLEPTVLAKPGNAHGLPSTGPGLACQESTGRVFGRVWNRTDPFLRSKPGLLVGYLDPLLTLPVCEASESSFEAGNASCRQWRDYWL
jgi:hypothetical protein